jgi:hypothetical protein
VERPRWPGISKNELQLWDIQTGQLQLRLTLHFDENARYAWAMSLDDAFVVSSDDGQRLTVLDIRTVQGCAISVVCSNYFRLCLFIYFQVNRLKALWEATGKELRFQYLAP